MAQRTGSERLLEPPAKRASAGVSLALALAALLALAGCGGGSSAEDSSASSAAAAPGSAQSRSQAAEARQGGGGDAPAKEGPEGSPQAGGPQAQAQGSAPTQKQGPRIAAPTGPREQAPTPQQIATATVADMTLESPAIPPGGASGPGALPAPYTCDGKGSWPALHWSGVPAGTAELILYAMSVQPVEGKLFVDWAVAGLDPGLEEIEAGKLPRGAITGTNGFGKQGYEICPSGAGEIYMFAIYALPRALDPPRGFDARELRKRILDVSGNVGLLPALYARG